MKHRKSRLEKLKRLFDKKEATTEEYDEVIAEYEVSQSQLMEWKHNKSNRPEFGSKQRRGLKSILMCCGVAGVPNEEER